MNRLFLLLSILMAGFHALYAIPTNKSDYQTNMILALTDDLQTLKTWKNLSDSITGCNMQCSEFVAHYSVSEDQLKTCVADSDSGNITPKAVFLQIGCNSEADEAVNYEDVLFDFPVGNICTLTGKNARNKRLAVSKPDSLVDTSNFAGRLYMMVKSVRSTFPQARVFVLSPVAAGSSSDDSRCRQLEYVANMMCVPFIHNPQELAGYRYFWNGEKPEIGKLLILGDSYSEQGRWVRQLSQIAKVDIVNLGVSSATVRDKYADRIKYPYSDNPISSDNEGNHNTLSSQLCRLKRLMAAENLNSGEISLKGYVPDVIILQGGSNDNPDIAQAEADYVEDIRQSRRTSFAGALGYLVFELRKMFPQARIFITTTAGLYYGHTDRPFDFILKSNQQRRAAKMLGCPVINWDLDGRLSFVFNNSAGTGDGSEQRPFRYNVKSDETIDLLHPNENGALFLAESALHWMTVGGLF